MFRKLNRFLKWLDPEILGEEIDEDTLTPPGVGQFSVFHSFWPIKRNESAVSFVLAPNPILSESAETNARKNGEILEVKAFLLCLSYLEMDDLKRCRLVCRHWKTRTNPSLKVQSAVVIHGEDVGSLLSVGSVDRCVKFLKSSVTKFSLWNTLRLTNVKETQMRTLLECRDFQIAVKSITELQLITCEISWKSLLKLMKQFINMQTFTDKKTVYTNLHSSSVIRNLTLWNSSGQPNASIESNFVRRDICLEDLKCVKIFKVDTGQNTTELIKILTVTTVDLEEFHLKLNPQSKGVTIKDSFEFERHLNILFILNARSLKKLYIDMMDTDQIEYFNDFLKTFQDWSSHMSRDIFNMEQLILKFKYIWLSRSFESILIPFVAKLSTLKVLGIGSVSFNPNSAHLLVTLKQALPPTCTYEFGIFVSDHLAPTAVTESAKTTDILKADVYHQCMTDLLVGVFHDDVTAIRDLLPIQSDEPMRAYEKTVELSIFTDGVTRPNFHSFDIQLLCQYFVNVTNLEIVDGPYDSYFKNKFSKCSQANIDDDDLQTIIKCMQKLHKLMIFANMDSLTDTGVTGLPPTLCRRMRAAAPGHCHLDPKEMAGYQFQSLTNLRYLSLRGVGSSLTDVSAYWGFSNIKKLKTLIVSHFGKISPKGRDYLETMYPQSRGCFVAIFSPPPAATISASHA